MLRYWLLTAMALLFATSCVPGEAPRVAAAPPPPRALLEQLDLAVPRDLPPALAEDRAAPAAPRAAPPFVAEARSPVDAARALDCLTAAVYYEARSESEDGQRAVAQVVLNRVRDRAFPSSVCGVVYQGAARATGCQFSFTCDGSMAARREPEAWRRAQKTAAAALAGAVYAPVGSATFYHADYVSPWWAGSMARVAEVGAHIFYRWRGAMENALAFRQAYSGAEPAAGGGWAAAEVAASDVIVHRASDAVERIGSVTIHRGGSDAEADAPAAARPMLVSGVRVHRLTQSEPDEPI